MPLFAVKNVRDFAKLIDHTQLAPDADEGDIRKLCLEAKRYGFHCVCVNPYYVPLCAKLLKGSGVKICAVAGFPLGASRADIKASEARVAVAAGADEIDVVMNIGAMKSGRRRLVLGEIKKVRSAVRGKVLKVIIEVALLSKKEKLEACLIAKKAGADFVKTSTGFAAGGARVSDVRLMRAAVGDKMGVKAAGGIRNAGAFLKMLSAGASRIGTSGSVGIIRALKGEKR